MVEKARPAQTSDATVQATTLALHFICQRNDTIPTAEILRDNCTVKIRATVADSCPSVTSSHFVRCSTTTNDQTFAKLVSKLMYLT